MNFDYTVTFSVVLGISAVIAPFVTSLVKSFAGYKLKVLELKNAETQRQTQRIIEIFDAYALAAGRCVASPTEENLATFGAASAKAELYAPQNILPKMQCLRECFANCKYSDTTTLLDQIMQSLRAVVKI